MTLIDNYDSFTFNLVHYLGELGADVTVWRNDEITVADVLAGKPDAIVLSPGPCTPNEAGICLDLVREAQGQTPILGVCLGHQAIGQVYGGEVVRAPTPRPRQDLKSLPSFARPFSRPQWAVRGDALSFPDHQARTACRRRLRSKRKATTA